MLLRTLQFAALVAASSAVDITGTIGGYEDAACTTLKATGIVKNYTFGACEVATCYGGPPCNTAPDGGNPSVAYSSIMCNEDIDAYPDLSNPPSRNHHRRA